MELPLGIILVKAAPDIVGMCLFCGGGVKRNQNHISGMVRLDIESRFGHSESRNLIHVSCWERGQFIVEDGLIRGWDCHCCSCPDFGDYPGFSHLCRNHGGAHGSNGCVRHRQPAITCDDSCCAPEAGHE